MIHVLLSLLKAGRTLIVMYHISCVCANSVSGSQRQVPFNYTIALVGINAGVIKY